MFPHLAGVVIEKVERPSRAVEIWGRVAAETACCPSCGTAASRVHSRYRRRLGDASIAWHPVVIHLTVRRFFCPAADCSRQTFAEQVPGLTWRYGRRTVVARQMLEAIGLALAGRAGARLAAAAGIAVGRATLLRLVRALPEPVAATPVVLGIDDFALRRGTSYGTVLADMVTRRPVDLLAGRHAQVVEDWLAAHPGVQVICRDQLYAFAAAGCGHPSCQPLWQATTSTGSGNVYISLAVANGVVYAGGGGPRVDAFTVSGCGTSECSPTWAYSAPETGIQLGVLAVAQNTLYAGTTKGLEAFPARCQPGSVCTTPVWTDPAAVAQRNIAALLVANGVVYATAGLSVLADNATTGTRLWSAPIPGSHPPRNGPTVANGTVYVADTAGAKILAYHL